MFALSEMEQNELDARKARLLQLCDENLAMVRIALDDFILASYITTLIHKSIHS